MNTWRHDWPKHLPLFLLAALSLFPVYFILANSLKTTLEFAHSTLSLPGGAHWANYALAWQFVGRPILLSLLITVSSVLGILAVASLSAYAFAHLRFAGRELLYNLVFVLLFIPGFLTLIPLYLQIKHYGLSGQPLGLILPYIAGGQAFSIFVLKTFFAQIPRDLFEAAQIDGASEARIFWRIVLPLSLPVLVSVGIINFVPIWNDYLLPQLVLNESNRNVTVPIALVGFQTGAQSPTSTNFGALLAGYVLASIPLVLIFGFFMRYYVEGLSSGAVKA